MTSKATLHFSIAGEQDAGRLQQLIQSAFRAEDTRTAWVGDAGLASSFHISIEEVLPIIQSPDSEFIIVRDPGTTTIVGAVAVMKRGHIARLALLSVNPAFQRGGIGRQVVCHAQDYCQQTWGVRKLALNALSSRQALIAWYLRCGFQTTGEKTPFPRDRFPDMRLPDDLCFIELEKDITLE